MKALAIRHVGIATSDSTKMADFFIKHFGGVISEKSDVPADMMESTFVKLGDELLELMQPHTPGMGTIGKFIGKKGEGMHHISLAVDDIDEFIDHCSANEIPLLPASMVGNHKCLFVHPKACGLLIEVVQYDYLKNEN